jgi:electron transport complex protein RnfC
LRSFVIRSQENICMSIHTFKGGIHPNDGKHLSRNAAIETYRSKKVIVPMSQHIGIPAKPIIKDGDYVKKGQLIGESGGAFSAKIHAPISGIAKITDTFLAIGRKSTAVLIENSTENDDWIELKGCENYQSLSRDQICSIIADTGIVGMGGATFPTHIKTNPPAGKTVDSLIINGVECEPYLTSDYRLMLESAKEILEGVRILMHTLNLKHAHIGIEANKPEAVKLFTDLLKCDTSISVYSLHVRYPQGAEKVLIKSILNREVPPGGLPMDVGVVVQNVGTAFAIYEAVRFGKPLIERIVTITGECIKCPKNFKVTVGTSVSELIAACGGVLGEVGKIISGGPMMGFSAQNSDLSVTKGTSGIVVLPKEKCAGNEDFGPCIKCGRCVNVCPMGLNPSMLGIIAEKRFYDRGKSYFVDNCFECGSCTYTCPSRRPMVQWIKTTKAVLKG